MNDIFFGIISGLLILGVVLGFMTLVDGLKCRDEVISPYFKHCASYYGDK